MDIERLEFGIDTFGDVTAGPDGALLPHDQVIRNLIDEAVLADEVGLDAIGVGEHHRDWPPRSQCSPRTTRCACSSASPRSTP